MKIENRKTKKIEKSSIYVNLSIQRVSRLGVIRPIGQG